MKSTGIRRKVDDLGRIVIPASMRRSLGIAEGDVLEVAVDGDTVILAKPVDRCVFCGQDEAPLEPFRGRTLCRGCVLAVGDLASQFPGRREHGASADPATGPPRPAAEPPVRHLAPAADPVRDERAAGFRDERREGHDPASTTAW